MGSPANFLADLRRLDWTRGLRAGLAVAVSMAVCRALHLPMSWSALGAFEGNIVDNGGPYRTRFASIAMLMAGGGVGAVLASLASPHLPWVLALTAVFAFAVTYLRAAGPPTVAHPSLRRFRLVPGRTAAEIEHVADATIELPRIADRHLARAYRYAYGVESTGGAGLFDRLVKADLRDGSVTAWSAPDCFAGEPVFVARPDGSEEDDGVLLAVVLDVARGASFLLALDARTLGELGCARVPHVIPFGFHGMFDGNT